MTAIHRSMKNSFPPLQRAGAHGGCFLTHRRQFTSENFHAKTTTTATTTTTITATTVKTIQTYRC